MGEMTKKQVALIIIGVIVYVVVAWKKVKKFDEDFDEKKKKLDDKFHKFPKY